jgi:Major Facilitator Superfamily
VLRDRRFAILFANRALSVLGAAFAPVALAFGVLGLPGATASTLSIVLTAEAVPMIAFMLLGGVIGDRLPRNRVMMGGTLFVAFAFLALGLMMLTGWAPVPAMVVAAAVSGFGVAVFFPSMTGIVPEVVAAERLQTANALLGIGANASRIAGFVLGGGTVVLIGPGAALVVSAGLFAAAAGLLAALRLPLRTQPAAPSSFVADLRDGWREFRSHQWLWVIVAQFSFLVMAFQAAHGVLGPVVAKQDLGGAAAWSAVLSGEAVGTMVGVLIALRFRPKRPMLVATLATAPMATPFLALGLHAPLWIVVAGAMVLGICFDIFGVLWQTTMQREIPAESLSRVSSYDMLGSLMFGPIGLLAAGPVAVVVGARPALIGCGVLIVLSTFAALAAPGVRRLTARPAVPVAAQA